MSGPSFPELYQDHFEYAWACLRRLGVPPEAQEDALQDLFLVVHRRLPEFAGRSTLKTWIFGVARRVAARHRRTEARRLRRHARLAAASATDPAFADDDELARREARRRLAEFLDGLDDERRAVFVLHLYEEMSAPEIAQTLGVNVNTVYSRIRLVREQFDRTFAAAAPAAVRVAKAPEHPPPGAQARVWAALLLVLGSGAAAAAPGAALVQGAAAAGHQAVAWALGLAAAGALVVVAAPRRDPSPSGAATSEHHKAAPIDATDIHASPEPAELPPPVTATPDGQAGHAARDGLLGVTTPLGPAPRDGRAAPLVGSTEPAPLGPAPRDGRAAPLVDDAEPAPLGPAPRDGRAAPRVDGAEPAPLGPAPRDGRAASGDSLPAKFSSDPEELAAADPLAREAELIAGVRAAIEAGRTDDALVGLRRHQREFPAGVLLRERLGLRAIALCRSERADEGRREAAAFVRAHPDSALAARVRQDCGLSAQADPPKKSPTP
ncbi:sigma-70 family RNA polymerase sigma factor [Nannocystis pusilla]|uniref:RNA polymerase sigma factor n=1 Tax=Nannocystis pusilla TaxID=889268 RepID=UPI003DA63205